MTGANDSENNSDLNEQLSEAEEALRQEEEKLDSYKDRLDNATNNQRGGLTRTVRGQEPVVEAARQRLNDLRTQVEAQERDSHENDIPYLTQERDSLNEYVGLRRGIRAAVKGTSEMSGVYNRLHDLEVPTLKDTDSIEEMANDLTARIDELQAGSEGATAQTTQAYNFRGSANTLARSRTIFHKQQAAREERQAEAEERLERLIDLREKRLKLRGEENTFAGRERTFVRGMGGAYGNVPVTDPEPTPEPVKPLTEAEKLDERFAEASKSAESTSRAFYNASNDRTWRAQRTAEEARKGVKGLTADVITLKEQSAYTSEALNREASERTEADRSLEEALNRERTIREGGDIDSIASANSYTDAQIERSDILNRTARLDDRKNAEDNRREDLDNARMENNYTHNRINTFVRVTLAAIGATAVAGVAGLAYVDSRHAEVPDSRIEAAVTEELDKPEGINAQLAEIRAEAGEINSRVYDSENRLIGVESNVADLTEKVNKGGLQGQIGPQGAQGPSGATYTLTLDDKGEIAELVITELENRVTTTPTATPEPYRPLDNYASYSVPAGFLKEAAEIDSLNFEAVLGISSEQSERFLDGNNSNGEFVRLEVDRTSGKVNSVVRSGDDWLRVPLKGISPDAVGNYLQRTLPEESLELISGTPQGE
jgi:hypothetical protein